MLKTYSAEPSVGTKWQTRVPCVHGERANEGEMKTSSGILSMRLLLIRLILSFSHSPNLSQSPVCSLWIPHSNTNISDELQRTAHATHSTRRTNTNTRARKRKHNTNSYEEIFSIPLCRYSLSSSSFGFTQCTATHYRQYRIGRFAGNSLRRRARASFKIPIRLRVYDNNRVSRKNKQNIHLPTSFAYCGHQFAIQNHEFNRFQLSFRIPKQSAEFSYLLTKTRKSKANFQTISKSFLCALCVPRVFDRYSDSDSSKNRK